MNRHRTGVGSGDSGALDGVEKARIGKDDVPPGCVRVYCPSNDENLRVLEGTLKGTGVNIQNIRSAFDDVMALSDRLLPYHDCDHNLMGVRPVVETLLGVRKSHLDMSDRIIELAAMAQCYHDIGYTIDHTNHERISESMAAMFLREKGYGQLDIDLASYMIEATSFDTRPEDVARIRWGRDELAYGPIVDGLRRKGLLNNLDDNDRNQVNLLIQASYGASAIGSFDVIPYSSDHIRRIVRLQREYAETRSKADAGTGVGQIAYTQFFFENMAEPRVKGFDALKYTDEFYTGADNPYKMNIQANLACCQTVAKIHDSVLARRVEGAPKEKDGRLRPEDVATLLRIGGDFGFPEEASMFVRQYGGTEAK